jgi:putative NADH-flavin reductase
LLTPLETNKSKKNIMQITILGASGQVGKSVVNEALKSGYQVKVLVRNPDKLGELKEKVEIIKGDLTDALSVEKAFTGSSAVINVAGAVKEPGQLEKFKKIGEILVEKMKRQGITRLVNISLAVISLPQEQLDFKRKALRILVNLFFKQKKQIQEALMAIIINEKDIAWTFVRPAFFSAKPGTGKVVADDKKMPGTTIMIEDLAMFMVEQVVSTEWIRKAPLVASK